MLSTDSDKTSPQRRDPGQDYGRSFRLACSPEDIHLVEALLDAEGYEYAPAPHYPLARRLIAGPRPLGSSLAGRFGYIYIQDASSMLPALALNPPAGARVLDLCASPGGKTSLLALLAGKSGFVLGNEPSARRLGNLRRNLEAQNLLNTATCSFAGEELPDFASAWDGILLDPPCSGWGTAEKHPKVLKLWQGDKLKPLIALQRRLLRRAVALIGPDGLLAYSTCTTNVEENEDQALWAVEELGLELVPLPDPPGFCLEPPARPDCRGTWRVAATADAGEGPDSGPAQGFFVALLRKAPDAGPDAGAGSAFQPDRVVDRAVLRGPCSDAGLLPEGQVAIFNDTAYFLPKAALGILPAGFAWRGFPLGRLKPGAPFKPQAFLRALLPRPALIADTGGILNLEETGPIRDLLAGRSLPWTSGGAEIGLYFKSLPLCRLQARGGRIFLPNH